MFLTAKQFLVASVYPTAPPGAPMFPSMMSETSMYAVQMGKDTSKQQQAKGAYQAGQHTVAFVKSTHEVAFHVEHGAVSCPVTIVTIIHLHSGATLNPTASI